MKQNLMLFGIVVCGAIFLALCVTSFISQSAVVLVVALQFGLIALVGAQALFNAKSARNSFSLMRAHAAESTAKILGLREQMDALFNIFFLLRPEKPLPTMSNWAADPDFIKLLIDALLKHKPQVIVEAGSGVSTLCLALAVKRFGVPCRIISLENNDRCFAQTSNLLTEHDVADVATVVLAPLTEHRHQGKTYLWYETLALEKVPAFDMVVIDGPPAVKDPLARLPAIPLLYPKMSPGCVCLLDDYGRSGERAVVQHWLEAYADLKLQEIPTQRGAAMVERQAAK